jgi:hypothetical protein
MAIDNDFGEFKQFIPDHSFQGRMPEKDFRLGEGYQGIALLKACSIEFCRMPSPQSQTNFFRWLGNLLCGHFHLVSLAVL